jgi:hypothetical protein
MPIPDRSAAASAESLAQADRVGAAAAASAAARIEHDRMANAIRALAIDGIAAAENDFAVVPLFASGLELAIVLAAKKLLCERKFHRHFHITAEAVAKAALTSRG